MQPQRFDSFRSDSHHEALMQYRDNEDARIKPMHWREYPSLENADKVMDELKHMRSEASEENTKHVLKTFQQTLEKIEAYLEQMPVIFKQLFGDLKDEMARLRIWHNTIESDFSSQLVGYSMYSSERNRVIESAFNRVKEFEVVFTQTKEKFYQEIYACNNHLDTFPVVEFKVKMPMDKVPAHFLPDLLNQINGLIPLSVGGFAQVVHVRPGSTIYSIRVPIEAVNNILSALHDGIFDSLFIQELAMIYSLSNVKRFKKGKTVSYEPDATIKRSFLHYFVWLLFLCLLIALILYWLTQAS
ncbi:MAG: hypothetical protein SFV22_19335 [Saprospiraceae bacterium]|nr:hypothetical protein [Saprospiraceae bacterium]